MRIVRTTQDAPDEDKNAEFSEITDATAEIFAIQHGDSTLTHDDVKSFLKAEELNNSDDLNEPLISCLPGHEILAVEKEFSGIMGLNLLNSMGDVFLPESGENLERMKIAEARLIYLWLKEEYGEEKAFEMLNDGLKEGVIATIAGKEFGEETGLKRFIMQLKPDERRLLADLSGTRIEIDPQQVIVEVDEKLEVAHPEIIERNSRVSGNKMMEIARVLSCEETELVEYLRVNPDTRIYLERVLGFPK